MITKTENHGYFLSFLPYQCTRKCRRMWIVSHAKRKESCNGTIRNWRPWYDYEARMWTCSTTTSGIIIAIEDRYHS